MILKILICVYVLFGFLSFIAAAFENPKLWRFSLSIAVMGSALHLFEILKRGWIGGRLPFTNTYETLLLLALFVMLFYFIALKRYGGLVIGGFVGLIAATILALTCLLSAEIEPLLPSLKSNWLLFHVVSAFLGYASFAVAAAAAGLYLCASAWPRLFHKSSENEKGRFLSQQVRLSQLFITIGFPFLTMGIATGAVWAHTSWGRYWNWDPKETWAFISWLCYAICLHMQREGSASPKKMAWSSVVSFMTVMFTYFGVNFWLSSLHAAYS